MAAARGTQFSVKVAGRDSTIAVVNGNVQISVPGLAPFILNQGQVSTPSGENLSLAEYSAQYSDSAAILSEMIAAIAVAAENNIGGVTAADLRQVADTVISNVPALASQIAAAVQTYAPTQTQVIRDSTTQNAPAQSDAVNRAVETAPTPQTTTPQVIDPSTVSRSG